MKLLELVLSLKDYSRIKRKGWDYFLVKPCADCDSLIKINLFSIQIGEYKITYGDLLADDWEIVHDK